MNGGAGRAILTALDGRPLMWLAERTGIRYHNLRRGILGTRPIRPDEWAAIRAALPALPPPPEATNGHASAEGAGEGAPRG